jgi:hypothetical protein
MFSLSSLCPKITGESEHKDFFPQADTFSNVISAASLYDGYVGCITGANCASNLYFHGTCLLVSFEDRVCSQGSGAGTLCTVLGESDPVCVSNRDCERRVLQ